MGYVMLKMTEDMAQALKLAKHRDDRNFSFPVFGTDTIPVMADDRWYDWPVDDILFTEVMIGPKDEQI